MRIVQTDLLLRIDSIERSAENISFNAWIANRRQRLTHVSILVNSKPWVTDVPLTDRPDVLEHLADIAPYSLRSGIAILNPVNRDQISGLRDEFRIIAKQDSREMGAITCATRDFNWERSRFPVPPFELAERVGGHAGFLQTGLRLYHDIKSNVQRHCDFRRLERVLDWGCGCGRILRMRLKTWLRIGSARVTSMQQRSRGVRRM